MKEFKIENMNCMSCVRNIEKELKEKDDAVKLKPDFNHHLLTVESKLSESEIRKIIEDAGYKVTGRSF